MSGPGGVAGSRNEWLLVLFAGSTNVADAVTRVALPLLAVQLTRSPTLVALVAVLITLPWLVTALHIGVLVDRKNRRTLMLAAEAARLGCVAVVLVAFMLGVVTLPLIYLAAVALGVAEVVAMTANASIIPAAVPRTRWQSAITRITAVEYLANGFVGAPVGGFLVAAGFVLALGSSGLLYLAGAVLLLLLVGNFAVPPTDAPRPVRADIKEGLRFLWGNPLLRTMALLIAVMAGSWAAWLAVIPVYAVDVLALDARQYGLLLTCLGAGGVVGTVLVTPVNRLLGRRWSMFVDVVGSFLLVAAPAVVPAAPSSAVVVGAAAFMAGLGGTMWTVNSRVIYQSLVPDRMLGRFMAASRLVGWGTAPVAAGLAGGAASIFGFRPAFAGLAVLCAALAYPYLRMITTAALAQADLPAPATATPSR